MKTKEQIVEQMKICIENAQNENVDTMRQFEAQAMARALKWVLSQED